MRSLKRWIGHGSVLQPDFVILPVGAGNVAWPPHDHLELCGLKTMRWPRATAWRLACWPAVEGQLVARWSFPRVETRHRLARFLRGMTTELPRMNCWSIAEH